MKRFIAVLICLMMLFSYAGHSPAFALAVHAEAVDESLAESPYTANSDEAGARDKNNAMDDEQNEPAENTVMETAPLASFITSAAALTLTSAELSYIPVTLPYSESATLSDEDNRSWHGNGAYAKGYSFYADAGMEVTITMTSDDFIPSLYMLTEEGIQFASDSISDSNIASIVDRLPYTGKYFIVVTQLTDFDPGDTGSFEITITVSEADETHGTVIQYAALQYPYDLYFLEINSAPSALEAKLEQAASAAYGMMRLGEYILAPIEWRYDDFDSGAPGIGMIIGDVILPDDYTYEGGELTVESPVLVYDPDCGPVEMVSGILQYIFLSDQERILPLGMASEDVEARFLSAIADTILMETADGYEFWAGVTVDVSKVDTSAVGVYYPVTLLLPPGIGFSSDEYLRMETAVYVLDPEAVDLRAVHEIALGVNVSWLKEVTAPELWVSVDGGEWQNVRDGGDWVTSPSNDFVFDFPGSSPYTELHIYFTDLESGRIYDFEVRYEDGGVSVNRLVIDLTGDLPELGVYEGDRTGGDRYKNPWDVITGGNNGNGNGNENNPLAGDNPGGYTQNGLQSPGSNGSNKELPATPDTKQETTTLVPGGNESGSAPQAGNLILEPTNPVMTADMGTESGSDALPYGSMMVSGLSTGIEGFYFDLDGSDKPIEIRFDFPFEDFDGLYMNGELWTPGVDYSARAGSTVITVSAARLTLLGAGTHTLTAVFAGEPVEIVFTLNAYAPVAATHITRAPAIPQIPLPNILTEPLIEQIETVRSFPIFPFIMGMIGVLGFGLWLTVILCRRAMLVGR